LVRAVLTNNRFYIIERNIIGDIKNICPSMAGLYGVLSSPFTLLFPQVKGIEASFLLLTLTTIFVEYSAKTVSQIFWDCHVRTIELAYLRGMPEMPGADLALMKK
jgi:hypothetical protein